MMVGERVRGDNEKEREGRKEEQEREKRLNTINTQEHFYKTLKTLEEVHQSEKEKECVLSEIKVRKIETARSQKEN